MQLLAEYILIPQRTHWPSVPGHERVYIHSVSIYNTCSFNYRCEISYVSESRNKRCKRFILICYLRNALRLSLLFYVGKRRLFNYLLFSSAVLRAKGAESIVFDSGLIVTLLLFDS